MQASSEDPSSQGRSPSLSPSKRESVSTSQSTQGRGKKRPQNDQSLESGKCAKLVKMEDSVKRDCPVMKFEDFADIASKCEGLTSLVFIDQLLHVMHQEQNDYIRNPADIMPRRTVLASIIATTEKNDCLTHFVHLGGLGVLNDWLQEAHKGKLGNGIPKDGDKDLEVLLLTLIRALGKLPVDLDALRNCIVGKSVNKLRTHRNIEIQKKARELVDAWKEVVHAEMKSSDAVKKRTANSWPSKYVNETQNKLGTGQCSVFGKPGSNVGNTKVIIQSNGSKGHLPSGGSKGATLKPTVSSIDSAPVVKEEKSCSSSQSQNNCNSCCSQLDKGDGVSKDDMMPDRTGMLSDKSLGTKLHKLGHPANKSYLATNSAGSHKDEIRKRKCEKLNDSGLLDKVTNNGGCMDLNNQRLIVRLPNPGRNPSQNISGRCLADGSATVNRGSPTGSLPRPNLMKENVGVPSNLEVDAGDFKYGILSGADVNEKNSVGRASISEAKDCKSPGFKHMRKDLVCKRFRMDVRKRVRNSSKPRPEEFVLDDDQVGGIDLLASVAACEDIETQKSLSSSSSDGELPVSRDVGEFFVPGKVDVGIRHQGDCKDGEMLNEAALQIEVSIQEKLLGDSALDVATQLVSMSNSGVNNRSPPLELESDNAAGHLEHRHTNSFVELERVTAAKSAVPSMEQCQLVSESSHEGVAVCSPVRITGFVDPDCNVGDALQASMQVAKEVEQEVQTQCKPGAHDVKPVCVNNSISQDACCSIDQPRPCGTTADLNENGNSTQGSVSTETLIESTDTATQSDLCIPGRSFNEDSFNEDETVLQINGEDKIGKSPVDLLKVSRESFNTMENVSVVNEKDSSIHVPRDVESGDSVCVSGDVRPIFDLNEGLTSDEAVQSNFTHSATCPSTPALPASDPSPGPSARTCSLAAPVAVLAATKGAFIPPSNLSWAKSEMGWKGSASTSAFRPAEPRRVVETSQPSSDASVQTAMKTVASTDSFDRNARQLRILDIDLNIADERVLEDSTTLSSLHAVGLSEVRADDASKKSRPELDLNKVDENEPSSPLVPAARCTGTDSLRTNAVCPAAPHAVLDFDLNDRLGLEEEASSQLKDPESSDLSATIGYARQDSDIVSVGSWCSASFTPTRMVMPSLLSMSGRSESSSAIISGPRPVLNMGCTFGPVGNDLCRRAATSASADPCAGSIPSSFSHGSFPFGTGFPLTPVACNMGSPFNPPPSSPFLHAGPSPQVSAATIVSPYGGPYMAGSLRGIPGMESSAAWIRPCLDLNCGPDVGADNLDARASITSGAGLGQLSYHHAAPVSPTLKRKEPEGSFDPPRFGFEQAAWR
ncbi:hypothetical protein KP509_23G037400 [Ceratopteris richardii]|nr:hypothetical protein KP509_23G037400 [Ceratopteris richardii]KAH7301667.1 hypothetical protein KP509_23G037400 [Ceratopteris richardii]KAH7301668.1 hypothetical protein KP509_23G037400 [Ceratopteris richardii]